MACNNHYNRTREYYDEVVCKKEGFYDAKSKTELRHSCYQLSVRKKIFKIFKTLQTPNNLDIGCGNGDFLIELAKRYPNLGFEGIDYSTKQIKLAKANSIPLKNIAFRIGDVLRLDLKDKSYDTIFFINVLHHIKTEDHIKALSELARVAKQNIILEIKNGNNFYYKYIRTGFGKHKPYLGNIDGLKSGLNNIKVYPTTVKMVSDNLMAFGFRLVCIRPIWFFSFLSPLLVLYFKRRLERDFCAIV